MTTAMHELEEASLSKIHPAFPEFKVKVKIDRSYKREVIRSVGEDLTPMKEVVAVDIVVYDEEGTKMVAKLKSEDSRERFMWMITEEKVYEVCNPAVEVGGEGVHSDYHLRFHGHTQLRDSSGIFPLFPYTIKTVSQLAAATTMEQGFFDVVGFVRLCSPISKEKYNRFWEQELRVVLNTFTDDCGWLNHEVVCILRGDWVEAIAKLLTPPTDESGPLFVHVRYVTSCEPYRSGVKVVRSYSDASTLDINPPIPQVQMLKQEMVEI